MQFRIAVREIETGRLWSEDYNNDEKDPFDWASKVIEHFNKTLQPGEKARKLCMLRVLNEKHHYEHLWDKTNLITKMNHHGSWDEMKCKHCGITGRRWGLGSNGVSIDAKWRKNKKAQNCINT